MDFHARQGSPGGYGLSFAANPAAAIRYEALENAAAIRQAAERDAAAILQRATSQAAAMQQQAAEQAEAIRRAAEQEAAGLRAALATMSGELSRVAAYVTDNLVAADYAAPGGLAGGVAAPPAPPVAPERQATPQVAPGRQARPRRRPAAPARPAGPAQPVTKPKARPRQYNAMRIARYSAAALVTFALTAGLTEVGLHGPAFFTFRQGGTGETAGNQTDQQFLTQQAHHLAKGRHAPPKHTATVQKR